MTRLVMKFGGTSVADIDRIKVAARHVKREVDAGHEVAVVVSAMAGNTNTLVEWCNEISSNIDKSEYDTVVSAGEQITSGLMALALQSLGVNARSWQGWQIPVQTDGVHGKARITEIRADSLVRNFETLNQVAVCSGFQGIDLQGRIVTLGRNGSDTSAVALAAAISADRCDIYTDVEGIYTTDPRIEQKARRLDKISYEAMLEFASMGAEVMQVRSIELAMSMGVRILVRSSFKDPDEIQGSGGEIPLGTMICSEEEANEKRNVTAIASSKDESKLSVYKLTDRPGIAAKIFSPLAEANIDVDMIVQIISSDGKTTDLTFTVAANEFERAKELLYTSLDSVDYDFIEGDSNVVKVSLIGSGMRTHSGVAATAFKGLAERNINILAIATSDIKLSVLIDSDYTELAVRTLHSVFGLDN